MKLIVYIECLYSMCDIFLRKSFRKNIFIIFIKIYDKYE